MINNMLINISMLASDTAVPRIPYETRQITCGVLMVFMVIAALAMIVIVLMQNGNTTDLGAITGGSSDTFFGKNKTKSKDGRLKIATVVIAVLMLVLSITYFIIVMI